MIHPSDRRWPGYRGDDAHLLVQVSCCNCGHDEYQVEVCTPTTLDAYRDFLASTPCPDCGITETVSVVRIYEGRRPAASVYGGASLFTP